MTVLVTRRAIVASAFGARPESIPDFARRIYGIPDATDEEALQALFGELATQAEDAASQAAASAASLAATQASFDLIAPAPTVVMMSDSKGQFGTSNHPAGTVMYSHARGWLQVAWMLTPRFNLDTFVDLDAPADINGANLGVAGQKAGQWLARFDTLLDQRPVFAVIDGPTNDILLAEDAANALVNAAAQEEPPRILPIADARAQVQAQAITDYKAMVNKAHAQGMIVVGCTIPPISTTGTKGLPADHPSRPMLAAVNAEIRSWIPTLPNGFLLDQHQTLADPADTTTIGGTPLDGTMNPVDGIHPTDRAAWLVAQDFNLLGDRFLLPRKAYPDPTVNNLMPNWNLTGTGGMNQPDFGVTGPVADGWRVRHTSGLDPLDTSTAVCSKIDNPATGGKTQRIAVSLSGSAAFAQYDFMRAADTVNTAALNGKWVRMLAIVTCDGDGFRGLELSGDPLGANKIEAASFSYIGQIDNQLVLLTPPFKFKPTHVAVSPMLSAYFLPSVGGTAVVDVEVMGLLVREDPHIVRFIPS